MKEFMTWKDYENNYDKHIEEITRLQMLLDIEEQKLFELIKIKKQIVSHERKMIHSNSKAEENQV